MTINDMLEQGVVIQGYVEVLWFDPEEDGSKIVFSELEETGLMGHIDEWWADEPVRYVYSAYGENCITFEVG